jgi:hypothetical protein
MGKSAKMFKIADSRPKKKGNASIMGIEKGSKKLAQKDKSSKLDAYQKAIASGKSKRKSK